MLNLCLVLWVGYTLICNILNKKADIIKEKIFYSICYNIAFPKYQLFHIKTVKNRQFCAINKISPT